MSDQQGDYTTAGFGHELEPGTSPALLLVDPVRAYIDRECSLYAGVEKPVDVMKEVLAFAREAKMPVIITQVSYRPDGMDGGVFFRKVPALSAYVVGSPFATLIEGMEPRADELLITKQYPSAFFGTNLAATLTALGVDTLLIAGLSTSGCVRASALDAMQYGFIPIVIEDAVGDRDPAIHESNLFDIANKMAEVWPLSRIKRAFGS